MDLSTYINKAQLWYAWLCTRNCSDTADPVEAVREYLQKMVGMVDSELVLDQCVQQASTVSGISVTVIRRELRAIQKHDRRAVTSAENGQAGGRPKNDYAGMADHFMQIHSSCDAAQANNNRIFQIRFFRGAWRRYNGRYWDELTKEEMEGIVMTFCRKHYRDMSETRSQRNVMHNLRAADTGLIGNSIKIPCWLNSRPRYERAPGCIPLANGILNVYEAIKCFDGNELCIDSDVFQPLTPALFSLNGMDYPFDAEALCDGWLQYLQDVQPNPDDQAVLQMLCGLMLIPETRFNVFFLLTGVSGTGKSVFLSVLEALVGKHNTCCVPLNKFDDDHYRYQLTENLMNSIDDMSVTGVKDVEGTIKMLTDGRPLDVRRLYQDGTKAPATARTVAACNTLPRFYERSDAIWERLRVIPFAEKIRGTGKQNKNLRHELIATELPGIFVWALKGLALLQDLQTFPEHSKGALAKAEHQSTCDPEATYLNDHYVLHPDCRQESKLIYEHWRKWAEENGYRPSTIANLNRAVERVFGIPKKATRIGHRVCKGFEGLGKKPGAFQVERDEREEF